LELEANAAITKD